MQCHILVACSNLLRLCELEGLLVQFVKLAKPLLLVTGVNVFLWLARERCAASSSPRQRSLVLVLRHIPWPFYRERRDGRNCRNHWQPAASPGPCQFSYAFGTSTPGVSDGAPLLLHVRIYDPAMVYARAVSSILSSFSNMGHSRTPPPFPPRCFCAEATVRASRCTRPGCWDFHDNVQTRLLALGPHRMRASGIFVSCKLTAANL